MRIYYNNDQTELKRQIRTYQLHIHDEISVKTGEELKMSVLLSNADKVETSSSGEWREVQSDRLNENDGTLTIKSFLDSDAGTYRVLDTEGEILITVTVTESKEKLDTEQHRNWIVPVVVCLVILVALIVISVIIWRCQHRGHTQVSVQENKEHKQELEKL
ncbi:uncharacterized protein LOC107694382 isoform X3 [Sinocyclocheilus anshuiensis]|nr:PREDICTED: uncharacterized protein LOC107694382 isoform X3 [Sinocyclocheilus anshuiensis]XP_016349558.1 PREDICTED: uncharacterized protein LOC107694382 isoform X3 [Sinocyclocheilus anshuiensis]